MRILGLCYSVSYKGYNILFIPLETSVPVILVLFSGMSNSNIGSPFSVFHKYVSTYPIISILSIWYCQNFPFNFIFHYPVYEVYSKI